MAKLAALAIFLLLNVAATFQGTIDRVTFNAVGSVDGIVLTDKTYLRFGTEAVQYGSSFTPGSVISGRGTQFLANPNRVIGQLVINKGKVVMVDDAPRAKDGRPNVMPSPETSLAKLMFPFRKSAAVYVVGARADGKIDRVVLDDGVTIELPRNATIDGEKAGTSQVLAVYGTATSISGGRFGVAMSITDSTKAELLRGRGSAAPTWALITGTIRKRVAAANGDLEGLQLADGFSVRFKPAMLPDGSAARFQPDTEIEVAGVRVEKAIQADMIILTKDKTVIDPAAPVPMRGRSGGRASVGRGRTRARGH